MFETTTLCPDGCGATISAALVRNRRRMSDAIAITDKNERAKAMQRINGEQSVCPSQRRGR